MTVAGQAAYQLVLAPESHDSLIGQVRIAIDNRRRVPLRVQVFARGAARPALQVGFTAVTFGRPPAADYAFTPPAGATVTQQTGTAGQASGQRAAGGTASDVRVIGTGWLAVASLPESSLATLSGGPGLLPFRHSASSQARDRRPRAAMARPRRRPVAARRAAGLGAAGERTRAAAHSSAPACCRSWSPAPAGC